MLEHLHSPAPFEGWVIGLQELSTACQEEAAFVLLEITLRAAPCGVQRIAKYTHTAI